MNIINLTPHEVRLNNGKVYPSEGVARVSNRFTQVHEDMYIVEYGKVEGLPGDTPDTLYIVSQLVMQACPKRTDLIAPATGHPDTIRDEKGRIVSVPGFIVNFSECEPFVCFNENGTVELWMGMESKNFERVSDLVRHLRENNIKMSCRSCMFIYEGMI